MAELYVGKTIGTTRLEMEADAIAYTPSGLHVTGGHRLFGIVEGALLYAHEHGGRRQRRCSRTCRPGCCASAAEHRAPAAGRRGLSVAEHVEQRASTATSGAARRPAVPPRPARAATTPARSRPPRASSGSVTMRSAGAQPDRRGHRQQVSRGGAGQDRRPLRRAPCTARRRPARPARRSGLPARTRRWKARARRRRPAAPPSAGPRNCSRRRVTWPRRVTTAARRPTA